MDLAGKRVAVLAEDHYEVVVGVVARTAACEPVQGAPEGPEQT